MKFPRIRKQVRRFFLSETEGLSEQEASKMAEEVTDDVAEQVETGKDLNMNKSFGSLIDDPDIQPLEEMDVTLGELQEDVDKLEEILEDLATEMEAQEREYERITDAPEQEGVTRQQIRAERANKERMMYKAKLEVFQDIRQRLNRKVQILSEMVSAAVSESTDQNFDINENLEDVEEAIEARERAQIEETRQLGRIDDRLGGLQETGDMSVSKDLEYIEEKNGTSAARHTELSELAEEVLREDDSERRTPNTGGN